MCPPGLRTATADGVCLLLLPSCHVPAFQASQFPAIRSRGLTAHGNRKLGPSRARVMARHLECAGTGGFGERALAHADATGTFDMRAITFVPA
jgi:hypothetical protein